MNGSSQAGRWNTVDGQVIHEADGIFEGGGVKGVALVGALEGFAACGYTEWKSVAGTSAGAILAAYLAVGHSLEDATATIANAPRAASSRLSIASSTLEPISTPALFIA